MQRKVLIPVILVTIICIVLAVAAVVDPESPGTGSAEQGGNTATKFLSVRPRIGIGGTYNLSAILEELREPVKRGGSLSNLYHFLSRDPGRRSFTGVLDRRRARSYLNKEILQQAELYRSVYRLASQNDGNTIDIWVPEYLGTVRALFDRVKFDLVRISGYTEDLPGLQVQTSELPSVLQLLQYSAADFAAGWVPPGAQAESYVVSRARVRSWLNQNRQFRRRMKQLGFAWAELSARLYMLSHNPNWNVATQYEPDLADELEDLTVLVQAADLYNRSRDMLELVPPGQTGRALAPEAGISPVPDLVYFKNIPELFGQTSDMMPELYQARISLGYTFRDSRTQTWLNQRRDWLTDYFISYFSTTSKLDYSCCDIESPEESGWHNAFLKARALYSINLPLSRDLVLGRRRVYGVRDLAFVRVNMLGAL